MLWILVFVCVVGILLRKPNDWFAFFVMLAICVLQLRSSEMVTPRYLAVDALLSSKKEVFGWNGGLKPGDM